MQTTKQRKFMLVFPLLVIPFLTLAFYALGGGSTAEKTKVADGLNLQLPDAHLKTDQVMDKLQFYEQADKDSAKLQEWMRSDPYYQRPTDTLVPVINELEELTTTTASKYNQRLNVSPYDTKKGKPEEEVMQKLSLLQKALQTNAIPAQQSGEVYGGTPSNPDLTNDVDRLEEMMQQLNSGNGEDPEIKQLNIVMDKILDIQHPGRVKERMQEKVQLHKGQVFSVSKVSYNDTIVQGFYGMVNDQVDDVQNAIEAVVHANQVLVNGAVIKFRLVHPIYIHGALIPKGTFVFGVAALEGERLNITITSIRNENNLYPVQLDVYDMDGLPGIYIPGAITRDVAKQSTDNAISMAELSTMDPSLKAQATVAGINAAKSFLSKKTKLIKVLVKAGYKVLLKDKNVQP